MANTKTKDLQLSKGEAIHTSDLSHLFVNADDLDDAQDDKG
jgi:hypothetical protein